MLDFWFLIYFENQQPFTGRSKEEFDSPMCLLGANSHVKVFPELWE